MSNPNKMPSMPAMPDKGQENPELGKKSSEIMGAKTVEEIADTMESFLNFMRKQ